ncbi:MAG: acyl-CoA thioesterase [Deltaproteobacteria bacterium]|nr:acyl-CoA thioesterase [Deltaproteobacteria bacterium]
MRVPEGAVAVELTVPFHDVDGLHIVWHGHYVKYLEIARMELLRRLGLDIPQIRELGFRMLIAESHLRHVSPLFYGDRFRVSAWLAEIEARIDTEYEVFNLTTGRRAATARSVLVTTTAEGKLCIGTPGPILERLRP